MTTLNTLKIDLENQIGYIEQKIYELELEGEK